MNYKKKATKYITDKSGQIDNIVQDDVVKVEEIQLVNYNYASDKWSENQEGVLFPFPPFFMLSNNYQEQFSFPWLQVVNILMCPKLIAF